MDLSAALSVPIIGRKPDNARVDVYRTQNGSVKHVLTDAVHPTGYVVEYTPDNAIRIAIDTLIAAGVVLSASQLLSLRSRKT